MPHRLNFFTSYKTLFFSFKNANVKMKVGIKLVTNLSITLNKCLIGLFAAIYHFWYLWTYLSLVKSSYTLESVKRVRKQKIEMYNYLKNKLKSQL